MNRLNCLLPVTKIQAAPSNKNRLYFPCPSLHSDIFLFLLLPPIPSVSHFSAAFLHHTCLTFPTSPPSYKFSPSPPSLLSRILSFSAHPTPSTLSSTAPIQLTKSSRHLLFLPHSPDYPVFLIVNFPSTDFLPVYPVPNYSPCSPPQKKITSQIPPSFFFIIFLTSPPLTYSPAPLPFITLHSASFNTVFLHLRHKATRTDSLFFAAKRQRTVGFSSTPFRKSAKDKDPIRHIHSRHIQPHL